MIRSWRNAVTRKVWEGERPNQFRGLDFEWAVDLLLALNGKGARRSQSAQKRWSAKAKGRTEKSMGMTVNARWRICFEFRSGDAYDVEIVDYHKE